MNDPIASPLLVLVILIFVAGVVIKTISVVICSLITYCKKDKTTKVTSWSFFKILAWTFSLTMISIVLMVIHDIYMINQQ